MSLFDYDVNDFKDDSSVIPAGDYVMIALSADLKDTKDGMGQYVNTRFQVVEGPYKNRQMFMMFNTKNASEKAQNIGRAQFKAFRTAIGLDAIEKLDQLLRKPFVGSVVIKKDDGFGDKNQVTKFQPTKAGGKPWEPSTVIEEDAPF